MRIALDARACSDHFPGIARYIAGLLSGLGELGTGADTLVVLGDRRQPSRHFDLAQLAAAAGAELLDVPAGPFALSQQWHVPAALRACQADLYHATYTLRPYGRLPCPSITTIHDLIPRRFPGYFSWPTYRLIAATTRLAIQRSRRLIAVSESTRDDLGAYFHVPAERISVTYEGVDERFSPRTRAEIAELRARLRLPPRYLLYLGSNKPHKNLPRLIRGWAEARGHDVAQLATLVVAGVWDERFPEARELAAALGLGAEAVLWLGPVAEVDLPALYSGALAFVFPSIYEGFGLPPLEAMACGAPVIASYSSAIREVVAEAGLTVDPYNYHEIAEAILRVLRGQHTRQLLGGQSLRRAAQFTWERTAALTLRAYRRTLLG